MWCGMVKKCVRIEDFPIPVIRVNGEPRERGYQYGNSAKGMIHEHIDHIYELICSMRKIERMEIRYIAQSFVKTLKLYDSDIFDEMQGIAEGAEVDIADIVVINFIPELINPYCKSVGVGCTTIAIKNEKEYMVGQTYDWFKICKKDLVLVAFNDGTHRGVILTEAGCIGGIGFNQSGIAVLLNYLGNYYIQNSGVGYYCLLHRALFSDDLIDAQRNLLKSPISLGLNMLLASVNDGCFDYELTCKGIDYIAINERDFVHCNHFLSTKVKNRIYSKSIVLESKNRWKEAKAFLTMNKTEGRINECFKQHSEMASICRHENEDGVETLFTVFFDMNQSKATFQFGLPCCTQEYQVKFSQLQ